MHAKLGLVKIIYSFNFDPNKNPSRGFVPLGERSISTRGKKLRINSEGGKLFAQKWWCLSVLHHSWLLVGSVLACIVFPRPNWSKADRALVLGVYLHWSPAADYKICGTIIFLY